MMLFEDKPDLGGTVIATPWAREAEFSVELLEAFDWIRVETDPETGIPTEVLIAVANGMARYRVERVCELTGTVECRLSKARRTALPKPPRAKKAERAGRAVGFHSSTDCWGVLRRAENGSTICARCGVLGG